MSDQKVKETLLQGARIPASWNSSLQQRLECFSFDAAGKTGVDLPAIATLCVDMSM